MWKHFELFLYPDQHKILIRLEQRNAHINGTFYSFTVVEELSSLEGRPILLIRALVHGKICQPLSNIVTDCCGNIFIVSPHPL